MKNFHLPLPDETYAGLRTAAERSKLPATVLAREAIAWWLRQEARRIRHAEVAAYASEMAGTSLDLDPDMEAAGIEHLVRKGKAPR